MTLPAPARPWKIAAIGSGSPTGLPRSLSTMIRVMARRILKILHELGAIGLTGALAAYMILLATAPDDSLAEYAAVRRGIEAISGWLLVPSLMLTLVTGLLAIAAYSPFQNAWWVWIKAALGFPMFEGTLITIDATAQHAAALSARAVAGEADPALMADLLAAEWRSLWLILALSIAQTVIGVWRPRMRWASPSRRRARLPSGD